MKEQWYWAIKTFKLKSKNFSVMIKHAMTEKIAEKHINDWFQLEKKLTIQCIKACASQNFQKLIVHFIDSLVQQLDSSSLSDNDI